MPLPLPPLLLALMLVLLHWHPMMILFQPPPRRPASHAIRILLPVAQQVGAGRGEGGATRRRCGHARPGGEREGERESEGGGEGEKQEPVVMRGKSTVKKKWQTQHSCSEQQQQCR